MSLLKRTLELTIGYKTGSGNLLSMDIYGVGIHRDDVPLFFPRRDLYLLCGECSGWNGGCPPFAPYFTRIKPSMSWFYALVVRMDVAWGMENGGSSAYFQFHYCDRLTANYMLRITRKVAEMTGAFALDSGGCSGCKSNAACSVTKGQPCVNPQKRTYSAEAVGVDCSTLHEMIFESRLPYWYYDGILPRYMYRYGGFFVPGVGGFDDIVLEAITQDKSYVSEIPTIPKRRLVRREAPSHVYDAGLVYEGYLYIRKEKEDDE